MEMLHVQHVRARLETALESVFRVQILAQASVLHVSVKHKVYRCLRELCPDMVN